MYQKRESPAAVAAARGAKVLLPDGNDTKHNAGAAGKQRGRRQRNVAFADWIQGDEPCRLGLYDENVARIRRCMAKPEARGVTSIDGLIDSLKFLKKPFYSGDDQGWRRLELTARSLWWAYRGRVP